MMELLRGKYILDACIGRGGMAEVFAGRTLGAAGFSQRVAIKRIHAIHGSDAQFRAMFTAEAQLSSHLRHSNIVRVFDFDEDEAGCLFLVMEYVDGLDLDGLSQRGLLPLPVILFVIGEILRGLAYVHELPPAVGGPRGLVHRDISPQNVLVSWDGTVQITDFGIAKARTATQAGASLMLKGKPAYMSPEQIRGLALDGRSDIFAVGVMLWELLCGAPLFHDPHDMSATLAAVMFGDTPPPSARAPRAVPGDIERVAMRMLQRERASRPDASSALAELTACGDYPRSGREALAQLLSERLPERAPQRAGHHAAPRPAPSASGPPHTAAQPPAEAPRGLRLALHSPDSLVARVRRSRLRGALLAAALVGSVGGAVLHLTQRGSAAATAPAALAAPEPAAPPPEPAAPVLPRATVTPPEQASASDRAPTRSTPERAPLREPAGSAAARPAPAAPRAVTVAPARPPPRHGGMGILDLGQPRRSATELDLGGAP